MKTTGSDVLAMFAGRSRIARREHAAWRNDSSKRLVVPVVEAHESAVVYQLTMDAVQSVCERTEHALGQSRRDVAERVSVVRDWHPDFAFTHVMHYVLERLGHLYTYQEFREFTKIDDGARSMLRDPAVRIVHEAEQLGFDNDDARSAVRWRVGNAYYSFLRELHVLVHLRDADVDAHLHPLADALFRTDLWVDDVIVSLYIGNAFFRKGAVGRKRTPEEILGDAHPPFRFTAIELPIQRTFGNVHLAKADDLGAATSRLRKLVS